MDITKEEISMLKHIEQQVKAINTGRVMIALREADNGRCFAHTVGMTKVYPNLPELIVVGVDFQTSYMSLHLLIEYFQTMDTAQLDGDYTLITDLLNMPICIVKKDVHQIDEAFHFGLAEAVSEALEYEFKLAQVVIPDPTGCFPWNPKCNEDWSRLQQGAYKLSGPRLC